VLTAGATPENPTDMFAEAKLSELFAEIEQQFDLVVVDSPPVNVVSDALVIGALCDATIFVVEAGRTPIALIRSGCDAIREAEGNLRGVIVNKLDLREDGYHYYYYYNDYYAYYTPRDGEGRTGTDV
jgi:capsular exopolysaccharide synthesis family protein